MVKGNNLGAIIILSILSIAGLGLSGYMFTTDLLEEPEVEEEHGNLKLVALWDTLYRNTDTPPYDSYDNFLVGFYDQELLDTEYVNVVNETRFTLPKAGLYKINLDTFMSTMSEIDKIYLLGLKQNESIVGIYKRYTPPTLTTLSSHVSGSVYINSTGGNDTYYEIRGYTDWPSATFTITTTQSFNQLSIEYVIK